MAQLLHISNRREAQAESAAVVQLRAAASDGGCGGTSVGLIQLPAQDQLVPVAAVLLSSPQSAGSSRAAVSGAGGSGNASGHGNGIVHSRRAGGGQSPGPVIQNAAIGELPKSNSPAGPWVFGALVLFGMLALLSAAGRRLAFRQGLASATGAPATIAIPTGTAGLAAPPIESAAAVAATPAATDDTAPPGKEAPADETLLPPSPAAVPASVATPPPPSASASPTASAPQPVTQAPPVTRQQRPREVWLRTHGSQIALVLTAATAGAARLMARDRGRRRR